MCINDSFKLCQILIQSDRHLSGLVLVPNSFQAGTGRTTTQREYGNETSTLRNRQLTGKSTPSLKKRGSNASNRQ